MFNEETSKYEGYIYQIYNPFNMKSYIGQTTCTIDVRLSGHKSSSKHSISDSCFLYTDARNFGWDVFSVYEIEKIECDEIDELRELLNKKEIYYIDSYDTLYPNGYNISPGGGVRNKLCYQKVYQFDANKTLVAEYESMMDAYLKTGIAVTKISGCCNGDNVTAGDFYWSKTNELPVGIEKRRLRKRVAQYTMDGKFIAIFDSTINAARSLTSNDKKAKSMSTNISRCANGKLKTAYGYIWKKVENVINDNNDILEQLREQDVVKSIYNCKPVVQYDKNLNYIRTFPSATEASVKTKINRSCISACVRGDQETAGGFIWRYDEG